MTSPTYLIWLCLCNYERVIGINDITPLKCFKWNRTGANPYCTPRLSRGLLADQWWENRTSSARRPIAQNTFKRQDTVAAVTEFLENKWGSTFSLGRTFQAIINCYYKHKLAAQQNTIWFGNIDFASNAYCIGWFCRSQRQGSWCARGRLPRRGSTWPHCILIVIWKRQRRWYGGWGLNSAGLRWIYCRIAGLKEESSFIARVERIVTSLQQILLGCYADFCWQGWK